MDAHRNLNLNLNLNFNLRIGDQRVTRAKKPSDHRPHRRTAAVLYRPKPKCALQLIEEGAGGGELKLKLKCKLMGAKSTIET